MWNKPLKIFKGVTNVFDIVVQDFDQQPVAVKPYVFRFRAVDNNDVAVLSKVIGFRPDSTNKLALDINRDEITDLDTGFYKWAISIDDGEGTERPIYLDLNGGVEGSMEVGEWSYADDALASAVLTTWTLDTNVPNNTTQLITGEINLDVLDQSQISPLHTVVIFKDLACDGIFGIEAAASNVVNSWSTPYNMMLTAGSTSTYANFYGVYARIRFRFTPSQFSAGDPGKVYYRLF
jgi:hypothetical protein